MQLFDGQPTRFAIIDLETTGGAVTRDRVIEIAVYVTDGEQMLDEFHTLVNPERPLPASITQLTGISPNQVANAPKFYEVAKQLVELTEHCVFVAHNVSFDYNFIKKEFKRLGYNYNRKRLCTVRLARRILPGYRSYSLGKLCRDLDIPIRARHRAAGDALATVQLFQLLLAKDEEGLIPAALKQGSREALLPPHLARKTFNALPNATGVYYMHNQKGEVIYVGKANNIKQRVTSHFTPNLGSRKALRIKERVHDISYEVTGSELVALLLESHEIKHLRPVFNTQQKRQRMNFGLYDRQDDAGYRCLEIRRISTNRIPHTAFTSAAQGKRYLAAITRNYELCERKTGLDPGSGPCFNYQVHRCRGACCAKEPPGPYNQRVQQALEKLNVQGKNLIILEKGRHPEEKAFVMIENDVYLGFGFLHSTDTLHHPGEFRNLLAAYEDNTDVQRILNQYLRNNRPQQVITF